MVLMKNCMGFPVPHLPYVLAQKGRFIAGETNRIFHLAPQGEEGNRFFLEKDGVGYISTGPSGNEFPAGAVSDEWFDDRVITSQINIPLCMSRKSAHAPRCFRAASLSITMGSSLRLPLVMTRAVKVSLEEKVVERGVG